MNDKELADRIVGLGVGKQVGFDDGGYLYKLPSYDTTDEFLVAAELFIADPRVAMALMEKVTKAGKSIICGSDGDRFWAIEAWTSDQDQEFWADSLERAICEACCEALENE